MNVALAPVRLGPVALSGERLLVAVAILAGLAVAELLARRRGRDADWAWSAVIIGLLAARLGWVAANLESFAARPLEAAYVWQGGFSPWVGALAAGAWIAWRLRRLGAERARDLVPALGVAALAGILALAFLPPEPSRPSLATLREELPSLTGDTARPADWVGSPVVVNLWATWCGPCRRELPMLIEELAARDGVALALVSQGEARTTVTRYLEDQGLPRNEVWLDRGRVFSARYGVVGLPTTLFVGATGEVRAVAFGELSRARLRTHLDELGPAGGG